MSHPSLMSRGGQSQGRVHLLFTAAKSIMTRHESATTCDVAVVGAGVFGAWTAYLLQQSGKHVEAD